MLAVAVRSILASQARQQSPALWKAAQAGYAAGDSLAGPTSARALHCACANSSFKLVVHLCRNQQALRVQSRSAKLPAKCRRVCLLPLSCGAVFPRFTAPWSPGTLRCRAPAVLCLAAAAGGQVVELQSDAEYQAALKELAASKGGAIIDFTAVWCACSDRPLCCL